MATCNYRLAIAPDAEQISQLSRSVIEAGLHPSWPARRVLWHMHDRNSVVLTASCQNAMVGFAIMQFGDDRAHLNLLAVEPSQQRCGIGRHMLHWLETTALTAGTFVITLEVRASNPVARAFYTACEYREVGTVEGYYQGRDSAIKMSRDLRVNCPRNEHPP